MRDNHSAAEKIKEISGTNPLKCMKCGKCSATCPSFDEMDIKPNQFETAFFIVKDFCGRCNPFDKQ